MTPRQREKEQQLNKVRQLRNRFYQLWIKYFLVPLNSKHIHGKRYISYSENELVVVCLAKNAEVYIRSFIEHYIALGVKHIFIMDNGSTDNTVSIASRYPQVSIYYCSLSFRKYNLLMRQYMLRRFCNTNRWVLCVDIDELFDYPYSDRVKLGALLQYLGSKKYTTMVAYMLDMFSGRPFSCLGTESVNLKQDYPYYDISSINKSEYREWYPFHGLGNCLIQNERLLNLVSNSAIKHYMGGIRGEIFDLPKILLIKHPLIFKDGKSKLVHQHFVNCASVADISGVLYHYKLSVGFKERIKDAINNRQYWNDSMEYTKYNQALENNPDICCKTGSAEILYDVNDLVRANFLHVTDEYIEWCKQQN